MKKLIMGITEGLALVIPNIIKESKNGKISSRRVFKIVGGGGLVTVGVMLVQSNIEPLNEHGFYAGFAMIVLGVVTGYLLKSSN